MVPRKIALITPSVRLLGARRSLLALVKALDTARFVPIVVCPRRGDLQELLVENRIPTHTHALPPWRKVRYWPVIPSHIRRLSRWAEGLGISLLHANEAHSAPYAIRVGQRLGIPTISHIRLPVTERMIRNYELRHADRVVAVSHAVAEAFRSWPDCEKRVRVIYNGLDVEQWRRAAGDIAAARRGIRQRLGLAPDAFLIGQVGLIGQRKQQHLFVEAARRMASRPSSPQAAPKANCHFLIVGNPSPGETAYSRQLAQAIESAGLSRQITIWPFERQIEPIFAGLDLNLLISNDEGFGRVAIEAGALGIPTIGTRIGGIPEVICDGETGLLVGVNDTDALAGAIERLAADSELRLRMGEAARQRAEQLFSIAAHARQIMNLYDEVLKGSV